MCQALPGLRCANYLRKNMRENESKVVALESEIKSLESKDPAGEGNHNAIKKDSARLTQLREEVRSLGVTMSSLQSQYNITQSGRNELSQTIKYLESNGDTSPEALTRLGDLKVELSSAQYQYKKAQELIKGERDGISKIENLKLTGYAAETFNEFNHRAQVAYAEMDDLYNISSGDYAVQPSRGPVAEQAHKIAVLSNGTRAVAGRIAVMDDSYDPGIYGVFHAHDGSIYLSKVVDSDKIMMSNRLTFENGRIDTGVHTFDSQTCLVEKTANGSVESDTSHLGRQVPARDTMQHVGVVGKHILEEAPEKDRQRLALMAREMCAELEKHGYEQRHTGERRLVDFPVKDKVDERNKELLLRAYKYTLYSPVNRSVTGREHFQLLRH